MKIYDYSNIEQLFVVGDIHGDFSTFFHIVKQNLIYKRNEYVENVHPLVVEEKENEEKERLEMIRNGRYEVVENYGFSSDYKHIKKSFFKYNDSVIIIAGDCGFGFNKFNYYIDNLTKINNLFLSTNTHIIFVRGNHDDPSYFSNELINLSNMKSVPDYSVIKTKHHNTLCVGGAISVDRLWRKQQEIRLNKYSKSKTHKLYWDGEECVLNENILDELRENNIKLDSVVTHTSPSFAFPSEKDSAIGWLKMDSKLKDDLIEERKTLTKLHDLLIKEHKIETWSYGHFHQQFETLGDNDILYMALDDNNVIKHPFSIRNTLIEIREENKKKRERKKLKKGQPLPSDIVESREELHLDDFDDNFLERLRQQLDNVGGIRRDQINERVGELMHPNEQVLNDNVELEPIEMEEEPF